MLLKFYQRLVQKLTSGREIYVPKKIKKGCFPKKLILDGSLPIKATLGLKINMVRMVHRNLFYNREFEVCVI